MLPWGSVSDYRLTLVVILVLYIMFIACPTDWTLTQCMTTHWLTNIFVSLYMLSIYGHTAIPLISCNHRAHLNWLTTTLNHPHRKKNTHHRYRLLANGRIEMDVIEVLIVKGRKCFLVHNFTHKTGSLYSMANRVEMVLFVIWDWFYGTSNSVFAATLYFKLPVVLTTFSKLAITWS